MSDVLYTLPSSAFESVTEDWPTGLVGTIGVQIKDDLANTVLMARTTANIVESPSIPGVYVFTCPAASCPAVDGEYLVIWDSGGATPYITDTQLLIVTGTLPAGVTQAPGSIVPAGTLLDIREWVASMLPDLATITRYPEAADAYGGRSRTPTVIATNVRMAFEYLGPQAQDRPDWIDDTNVRRTTALMEFAAGQDLRIGDTVTVTSQGSKVYNVIALQPDGAWDTCKRAYTEEVE